MQLKFRTRFGSGIVDGKLDVFAFFFAKKKIKNIQFSVYYTLFPTTNLTTLLFSRYQVIIYLLLFKFLYPIPSALNHNFSKP